MEHARLQSPLKAQKVRPLFTAPGLWTTWGAAVRHDEETIMSPNYFMHLRDQITVGDEIIIQSLTDEWFVRYHFTIVEVTPETQTVKGTLIGRVELDELVTQDGDL